MCCVLCVLCCDPSKRCVVAPAVYSRVFEILTTLTFGALRKKKKKNIVSTAFEDVTKKTINKKQ